MQSNATSSAAKYLSGRVGQSTEQIVDSFVIRDKGRAGLSLDWKKMAITPDEFDREMAKFNAVPRAIGVLSPDEIRWVSKYFDAESVETLKCARVKTIAGTCKCGRVLNVYDLLKKVIDGSIHSVDFMKAVMQGDKGKFLISARDGTPAQIAAMPKNTIWIDNTKTIECSSCGEPHHTLLAMDNFMHHWVLNMPTDEEPKDSRDSDPDPAKQL